MLAYSARTISDKAVSEMLMKRLREVDYFEGHWTRDTIAECVSPSAQEPETLAGCLAPFWLVTVSQFFMSESVEIAL